MIAKRMMQSEICTNNRVIFVYSYLSHCISLGHCVIAWHHFWSTANWIQIVAKKYVGQILVFPSTYGDLSKLCQKSSKFYCEFSTSKINFLLLAVIVVDSYSFFSVTDVTHSWTSAGPSFVIRRLCHSSMIQFLIIVIWPDRISWQTLLKLITLLPCFCYRVFCAWQKYFRRFLRLQRVQTGTRLRHTTALIE